ncbi:MAG TPA: hypothetical protein VIQ31_17345, partial [Phormidium sp.]
KHLKSPCIKPFRLPASWNDTNLTPAVDSVSLFALPTLFAGASADWAIPFKVGEFAAHASPP